MPPLVRIGCAAGFAGDRRDAAQPLIAALARADGPRFLIFETLAERTLALCQLERKRDPARGYSPAVERLLPQVLGPCLAHGIRIIGNFGGANPRAAGVRIAALAHDAGFRSTRIAVVEGDDLRGTFTLDELAAREVGSTLLRRAPSVVAANVYLGAEPIARALAAGADVVVAGRIADPALALGPLMYAHGWHLEDWRHLAAGALVGHLLECGAQVTGGYFADPGVKDVPGFADLGYPLAEVSSSGDVVITKPPGTGGLVDRRTVTEQILYEMHDPAAYLTPDVTLDVTDVSLEEDGPDRIRVTGARGYRRPDTLKATVFFESGVLGEAEISYAGPNAAARARLAAETVLVRMQRLAPELAIRVDAIGVASLFGNLVPSLETDPPVPEVRLRFAAQHMDGALIEHMLDEVEALYCAGPAGGAGVRRRLTPRLSSTSCLIERTRIEPRVSFVGATG